MLPKKLKVNIFGNELKATDSTPCQNISPQCSKCDA